MNILVINGSPRGAAGNTHILVQNFVEGAQEEGAVVETVFLNDKHIEHCRGCFGCWFATPGKCVIDDDMTQILDKVRAADMLVYATPLYVYTVSGYMKDFMDRSIPLADPHMETRGDATAHPAREGNKPKTYAVISTAGFPEQCHFDGMKATFARLLNGREHLLAGMICCAGGAILTGPGVQPIVQWYLDASKQAGREAATNGKFSAQTQATLDQPLVPDRAEYMRVVNAHFDEMLASVR